MDRTSPRLYVEDAKWWAGVASRDRSIASELGVHVFEGATILTLRRADDGVHQWRGGVVDAEGKWVAGHLVDTRRANSQEVIDGYPVGRSIAYIPEPVI